jgi:hypothetical protein
MPHNWRVMPQTQRRFGHAWAEIAYLCTKVRYWLYARQDRARARRYAARLNRLLRAQSRAEVEAAIVGRFGLSLCEELNGRLSAAAEQRAVVLQYLARVIPMANSLAEARDFAEHLFWPVYGRLAEMYVTLGRPDRAIESLRAARELCRRIRVPFESAAQLRLLERSSSRSMKRGYRRRR